MNLSSEEQERWIEHLKLFRNHSNRYNPNKSTKQKYRFLVQEMNRLGSISMVVKTHHVGRNTVHNAIRFMKQVDKTELPEEGKENISPLLGSVSLR